MSFADPKRNLLSFGLKKGMEVADLGAGIGHYTLAAAQIVGSGGHVCAVEIQKDLVEKLKNEAEQNELDHVDVLWSDLEKSQGSTLDDGTFDVVIISNVLFQIKNKDVLLKEAHRILKSGGHALVIDWSDSYGGLGPPEDHLIDASTVGQMAQESGFTVKGDISPGAHHWGVVLKK